MRNLIFIFLAMSLFTACDQIEIEIEEEVLPFSIEGEYDFSDKFHPASAADSAFFMEISAQSVVEIKDLYAAGNFLAKYKNDAKQWNDDARELNEKIIRPFSYKDSLTQVSEQGSDTTRSQHFTKHQGLTQICFKNLLIFECSWKPLYQDGYNMMTRMYYFEDSDYKNLFIINESRYDGSTFLEKLLFIEKDGVLIKISLEPPITSFWVGEIKSLGNGIIGIQSSTFGRGWPQNDYITLFSLKTKQYKLFTL